MFQTDTDLENLFEALKHLKYNKHSVVLFHLLDAKHEIDFDFENTPKRFFDVETDKHIDLYADSVKADYRSAIESYSNELKLRCAQYKIRYNQVDINADFSQVLNTFMIERQKFGWVHFAFLTKCFVQVLQECIFALALKKHEQDLNPAVAGVRHRRIKSLVW